MTPSELLAAIIHQCGGEVHLDRINMEHISGRQLVADIVGTEIILRLTSNRVQIFPACQVEPPKTVSPSSHSILTDDRLLEKERERAKSEKMKEWRAQTESALSKMPDPSSGTLGQNG